MEQKFIVMSADALVTEDLELLKTLPNYRKYVDGGAMTGKHAFRLSVGDVRGAYGHGDGVHARKNGDSRQRGKTRAGRIFLGIGA